MGGQDVENTGYSSAAQVALLPILPKVKRDFGHDKTALTGRLNRVAGGCFQAPSLTGTTPP